LPATAAPRTTPSAQPPATSLRGENRVVRRADQAKSCPPCQAAQAVKYGAMDADFLVIGSGLAGLTFALRAARAGRVIVLSKDRLPESATNYAQGGIASVWSAEDSFDA